MNEVPLVAGSHASRRLATSVTRKFSFEAAHQLQWHQGKCASLHGHSYRFDVTVAGNLSQDGIVVDFADIKTAVDKHVLGDYDHAYLNDFLPNPTAELIAADIADRLLAAGLAVNTVTVYETASCSATVQVIGG
ncbi:6-carboxytetrahydropterin synthase QueD [Mycobacterium sp. Aquia_213]|uniref:6-carboxytetrahydropterin synthase QueD n=1 Tax=Mycobacterium sp. Aquia_213 TaxID=2991728 RepID=UPI002271723C|nr:6-carboxytetrahydropterin synthase QueD [Mycobacterium sp. Aquia_213]WAC92231.1 6-carboxytetrahydropterin synthase QueD [Mycobacterium sp. Aquia_213]